jgi:SAM-dependent methyltransferase
MAHVDQRKFVEKIKNELPQYFDNIRVIDCGSYDVNGNIRDVFTNCEYVGVDNHPGPNVDWAIPLHHIDTPTVRVNKYDTVVSCEMLEHDYYWERSLKKMYSILKPNGLLLITCAGYNRREHGVEEFASDPTRAHYENITVAHLLRALDLEFLFSDFGIEYNGSGGEMGDFYFWGIKR